MKKEEIKSNLEQELLNQCLNKEKEFIEKIGKKLGVVFDYNLTKTFSVNSEINELEKEVQRTTKFREEIEKKYRFYKERLGEDDLGAGYMFVREDFADPVKKVVRKRQKIDFIRDNIKERKRAAYFYGTMAAIFVASVFPIGIHKASLLPPTVSIDYQLREKNDITNHQNNPRNNQQDIQTQPYFGYRKGHLIIAGYPQIFYNKVIDESQKKYGKVLPENFDEIRYITNFMQFSPQEHKIPGINHNLTWEQFQNELGFPINDGDNKKELYGIISEVIGLIN